MRGPFSAIVDLSKRRMTLMLDRRYAGQFALEIDPDRVDRRGQVEGRPETADARRRRRLRPTGRRDRRPQPAAGQRRPIRPASPPMLRGPGSADPVSPRPAAASCGSRRPT